MKNAKWWVRNLSVAAFGLSLVSTCSVPGLCSTAFAETTPVEYSSSSVQMEAAGIPDPPQFDDPMPDLGYYVYYTFTNETTPHTINNLKAEGITDVQFTVFPFTGQNKEGVVFSLETETDKGWQPVLVSTFQPRSKAQHQHMKLPRNDYKNFRIVVTSTNKNFTVMGYKQWTS